MNHKLLKQLLREFKAHPRKGALLALLLLVALYFWAPLVLDWTQGTDQAGAELPAPIPGSAVVAVSAPATQAGTATTPTAPRHPWQLLAGWIDGHPQMQPADVRQLGLLRNPFATGESKSMPAPSVEEERISIQDLGLVLSSTVVGPSRRTALVNGKIYAEGDRLRTAGGQTFTVAQIQARRVVLIRGGRSYFLEMADRSSGNTAIRSLEP